MSATIMTNKFITKSILKDNKLAAHKKLGQNFLVDPNMISRILDQAGPGPDETIIEIGVGLGALTIPLAKRVKQVIGLEIDSGIVAMHEERHSLPANVTLLHEDVLKCDLNELSARSGGRLKIIANLPYSISNPLLFKLIEHNHLIDSAVIMLQKEVGMRLVAVPGTKEYGVLSVLLRSVATVEKVLSLGPHYFHPRPKVDSVVVKISFSHSSGATNNSPSYDAALLKTVVKAAFQQRRKTLLNALSSLDCLFGDKAKLKKHIESAGISPAVRPDKLTLEEFISLAQQAHK